MKLSFLAAGLFFAVTALFTVTVRAQDTYFGTRASAGGSHSAPAPSPSPTMAAKPPVEIAAKDIMILTSVWGTEHKFVEVTDRLAEVLSHPTEEYEVGPEWLRADPAPGSNKVLVTVYVVNGIRYVMGNHEGIKLSLRKIQENYRWHLDPANKL